MQKNHSLNTVAARINKARLWERHMQMAKIGTTENGGVNRPALSDEDIQARHLLVQWARQRSYEIHLDEIANIFIRRPGQVPNLPAVQTGSHMDTQPNGGRFDGIYGVLAGLEVLEAIDDAKVQTRHPIEVVAWTNEEGSRFAPGGMGSMVYAGTRSLHEFETITDQNGICLETALSDTLEALSDIPMRKTNQRPLCYLEAHIEQGPQLERAGREIGVVTGIQGARWFNVDVFGESAHAGTTPMGHRKDALQDTLSAIAALNNEMADPTDTIRYTIGSLTVSPNSPNTVPEHVSFSIDLRHPDAGILTDKGNIITSVCQGACRNCKINVAELFHQPPCAFDAKLIAIIEKSATNLGLSWMPISSGAFHDALFINRLCPTGMIFIPCERGISHNPAEAASAADLAAGAKVLALSLVEIASS